MKPFRPMEYIRRFWVLILCVVLAGELLVFWYANDRQQYTATAVIRYTCDGVADGLAPDGTPLDVSEVYSPAVLMQAVASVSFEADAGDVRAHCTVEPICTEEQQRIAQARNSQGLPSDQFPDSYRVQLVLEAPHTAAHARELLDAILQNYCLYFTAGHTVQLVVPYPSSGLMDSGVSPTQSIRILSEDVQSMLDFLRTAQESWPGFRSVQNGLAYADLYDRCQQAGAMLAAADETDPDVDETIRFCEAALSDCYQAADACWQETQRCLSAKNLQRISSVQVQSTVQVGLYLALGLVLFLTAGCSMPVLLGRLPELAQAESEEDGF